MNVSTPELLLAKDLRAKMKGWRRQYPLTPRRKWRADFAFPAAKILVEVNGERYHGKYRQQKRDAEKYNFAQTKGWRVFVFPASLVMSKTRRALIVDFLCRMTNGDYDDDDCTLLSRPLR